MWIFTKTGFVSVVEKPEDKVTNTITVRSRDLESLVTMREDIYKLYDYNLGQAEILEGHGTDYKYRMTITRDELKRYMVAIVDGIDYDNFKTEIVENRKRTGGDKAESTWSDTLMGVWSKTHSLED